MKEVEILIEAYDTKENILNVLSKYAHTGIKRTVDTYYYDPLRDALKPKDLRLSECFRTRQKGDCNYITYKVDKFDENDTWIYSDEYETKIDSIVELTNIINLLGLKKLVTIDSTKHFFETDEYEIEFETVANLGNFIEVEFKSEKDFDNVLEVKQNVQSFIDDLNINVSSELNMGKPELMLRKLASEL